MEKYITVLNSDLDKHYWKAIQWDNSLTSIRDNRYYIAGENMNIPKNPNDKLLEEKTVVETSTITEGKATIINIETS